MTARRLGSATLLVLFTACGPGEAPGPEADPQAGPDGGPATEQIAMAPDQEPAACEPVDRMPLDGRASPYDSTLVELNGVQAKVCYGRPSIREREIFGGLVPYDTLWRTGANEPTIIHIPARAEIAGMEVEPGSYSIYSVPGRSEWSIIVNRSTSQWGIETQYSDAIRAQEVGRASVPAEAVDSPIELFTIRSEDAGPGAANIVLEWERTRVRIPIRRL
jgi:hypothetical protein